MEGLLGPSNIEGGDRHKPETVTKLSISPLPHIDGWVVVLYFSRTPDLGRIKAVLEWVVGGLGLPPNKVILVLSAEAGRG